MCEICVGKCFEMFESIKLYLTLLVFRHELIWAFETKSWRLRQECNIYLLLAACGIRKTKNLKQVGIYPGYLFTFFDSRHLIAMSVKYLVHVREVGCYFYSLFFLVCPLKVNFDRTGTLSTSLLTKVRKSEREKKKFERKFSLNNILAYCTVMVGR